MALLLEPPDEPNGCSFSFATARRTESILPANGCWDSAAGAAGDRPTSCAPSPGPMRRPGPH
jgi:hypothetical protein